MDTFHNTVVSTPATAPAGFRPADFDRRWTALHAWEAGVSTGERLRGYMVSMQLLGLALRLARRHFGTRARLDACCSPAEIRSCWPHPPPRPTGPAVSARASLGSR